MSSVSSCLRVRGTVAQRIRAEQEQVIHELRVRNEVQNHWFLVALRAILCASTLM